MRIVNERAKGRLLIVAGALLCSAAFAASPLNPEQERATFQLADNNLVVELAAAEPDVRAPVAVAWDADGRMFVAEMTDYPSGPVSGRIRMLEDRDGDGRYERATIFATNLAYPNGILPWRNGVLITAAPDILFLADTNGDGAADLREKILTGFAEGNQQLRVNGLFWGIDNWIYGANGRSDGEVKWADGAKAGSIRRHDFRFRPDTRQFEAIAGNSQFGMGHDDWGNRFPVFNATPIRHVVMEEHYLSRQPLLAGTDLVPAISPDDGNRVFALTSPNVLIPQPIGFFTSACGPSIYRGTALPESYRGNYFVCEPVQNVVQRRVLKPNGSTFVAEYAHTNKEFLASSDPWFHGVFTAPGPDGALYIVDFYRDLVEHPQWVAPELRDKVDWRKGEEHGRIWRVRAREGRPALLPKLSRAPDLDLVQALESDNGWIRDTAHRLLVERNARGVVTTLERLARTARKAHTRVHVLNILDALRATDSQLTSSVVSNRAEAVHGLDAVVMSALGDPSPRVREHAVRLAEMALTAEKSSRAKWLTALSTLAQDSDARVRLQLAGTFGKVTEEAARCDTLARLARHPALDEWQTIAILGSEPRPWNIISRLVPIMDQPAPGQLAFLERAARLVAGGPDKKDKQDLLAWLANWKPVERVAVASAFANGLRSGERMQDIAGNESVPQKIDQAALEACRNGSAPLNIRVAAVRLVPVAEAVRLVNGAEHEVLQTAATRAVFESNDAGAARRVFDVFATLPKSVRRQVIASAVRSRIGALELERAASENKVPLMEIDPAARQALEKSGDAEVKSRALALFKSSTSPDRDAVVEKFRSALRLTGNRRHGAEIFERTCAVCHQMQGVGAKVGPDLSGTGQQPRETLLVQILDPSRQVLPDFAAYTVTTRDGESHIGFIANETAGTLTLRRANEPDITFQRAEVKEVVTSGKSLMPDGLEAGMTEQDVADLIEFLRRPDRTLFTQAP